MSAASVPPPLPPTAGPEDPSVRLSDVDTGTIMEIRAPYDDSIPGEVATAVSAGEAWCAGAAKWAESPQGAGLGGFTLDSPAAADDWPTGMNVPHQGP